MKNHLPHVVQTLSLAVVGVLALAATVLPLHNDVQALHDDIQGVHEALRGLDSRLSRVEVDVAWLKERWPSTGRVPRTAARFETIEVSPAICTRVEWKAETTAPHWLTWQVPCVDRTWNAAPAPWRSHVTSVNDSYLIRYVGGAPGCLWTSSSTTEPNQGVGASGRDLTGPPHDIRIHAAWRDVTWFAGGKPCYELQVDLCTLFCD